MNNQRVRSLGLRTIPPRSGHQYSISFGDWHAVVTGVGAHLRSLTFRGHDVVVPFDADGPVPTCNGRILVPFPNRIADGRYVFEGHAYELPLDEHERRNAIHGYGYRSSWALVSLSEDSVTLEWRVPDMNGYPFDVLVEATYRLDAAGLRLQVEATNNGAENAPWAMGFHPWLSNGGHARGDSIDADNALCTLGLDASTHVTVDDRLLPTGTEPVEGTRFDLRRGRRLTEAFDDAWTDVRHDAEGRTRAVLDRPDGMRVTIGGDASVTSFQVCTGTGFPAETRPAGVAVEPQTAYANAFNTGRDLTVLSPGERTSSSLFIEAEDMHA